MLELSTLNRVGLDLQVKICENMVILPCRSMFESKEKH